MYRSMWYEREDREPPSNVPITGDMLLRMKSEVKAIPLESQYVPVGGVPLQNVSDEALLNCPPHLIAHIQRTAAQGGLQVISPRQTPFSCMMVRRAGERSTLGDHNVGSIADPDAMWPTIDGDDLSSILPDEPLAPVVEKHVIREKTRSTALVKGHVELADPVIACLIKGRAIIDILRRADVAGGADEMAALLANAWGIDVDDIMDLEGFTLGIEGELQRHAIRTDDVYPVMYAPVQYSSVISCGVSDLTKAILLPDTGIDWRRARVFCEAVFYNACRMEGLPINKMRGYVHPAGAREQANKPNTMTFYPAPGIAWSFDPASFSLSPDLTQGLKARFALPAEVRAALQRYVTKVRPVSYLVATGENVRTWQTTAATVGHVPGETLSSGYTQVVRTIMTGSVRGKTAAAAVRNSIFEIIRQAPSGVSLRLARYVMIAREECREHLGVEAVPDSVVMDLARRLAEVGSFIRAKLVNEADQRGHMIADWWEDLLSQAPKEYQELKEGTHGWAHVAVWLLFRHPTEKWLNLEVAISYEALRAAERNAIGTVALPAERGSPQRLLAAVEHAVKGITRAYAGFYNGVYDVGMALARVEEELPNPKMRKVETLREAAYLWSLRSRCFRGINVHLIAKDDPTPSQYHMRVAAEPADVLLKPAPYRGFSAWRNHMENSEYISKQVKRHFSQKGYAQITHYFRDLDRPILAAPNTTLTRYLLEPRRLYEDIEGAWRMLIEDVQEVIDRFCKEQTPMVQPSEGMVVPRTAMGAQLEASLRSEEHRGLKDYWTVICAFDSDIGEGVCDAVDALPEHLREDIERGWYVDENDLLRDLTKAEGLVAEESKMPSDVVR